MQRFLRAGGAAALAGALLLGPAGCGQGLTPIEGSVTVDGAPAPEGTSVLLAPTGDHKPAHGKVGPGGRFTVYTHVPGDGVMAGEYRVVLVNSTNQVPAPTKEFTSDNDPAYLAYLKAVEDLKKRPPQKGSLPVSYSNPGTTPLRLKVPDDGKFIKLDVPSGAAKK